MRPNKVAIDYVKGLKRDDKEASIEKDDIFREKHHLKKYYKFQYMPKKSGYTKTNLKVMKPKGSNSKTRKGGRSDAAIAKIATNAVKKIAEKKFMNSNNGLLGLRPTIPTGLDYVSTIAFSTTTGDSDDGSPISYGSAPVHEMKCLNPFKSNDPDSDLRMFAPLGKSVTPVSCKTRWRINRDLSRVPEQLTADPPPRS